MEGKGRNSIYSGSREAQVERQVKGKKVSGGTSKRVTEKEHHGRGTAISEWEGAKGSQVKPSEVGTRWHWPRIVSKVMWIASTPLSFLSLFFLLYPLLLALSSLLFSSFHLLPFRSPSFFLLSVRLHFIIFLFYPWTFSVFSSPLLARGHKIPIGYYSAGTGGDLRVDSDLENIFYWLASSYQHYRNTNHDANMYIILRDLGSWYVLSIYIFFQ